MAQDAFASTMVAALQAALAQGPNVLSINVDGQSVTYQNREAMLKEYNFWAKRVARANGSAPRSSQIYLGGFK